mgnify:CR=1 FL=1
MKKPKQKASPSYIIDGSGIPRRDRRRVEGAPPKIDMRRVWQEFRTIPASEAYRLDKWAERKIAALVRPELRRKEDK